MSVWEFLNGDSESIENRVVGGGKDHVFGLVQVDSKGFMREPRTDELELIIDWEYVGSRIYGM